MTTAQEHPLIYSRMAAIMQAVPAIGKNRKNKEQGFQFRGIDDVYAALHDTLIENKVFTTSEVLELTKYTGTTKKGTEFTDHEVKIRWTFWTEDGSKVTSDTIGYGRDYADKSASKAMAIAHKYALIQVFAIPTYEPDNDGDGSSIEGNANGQRRQQQDGNSQQPPQGGGYSSGDGRPASPKAIAFLRDLAARDLVPDNDRHRIEQFAASSLSADDCSRLIDNVKAFLGGHRETIFNDTVPQQPQPVAQDDDDLPF